MLLLLLLVQLLPAADVAYIIVKSCGHALRPY
jgi:hypothetical protein